MESTLPNGTKVSIMVSTDGKTIDFVDAITTTDGAFNLDFNGNKVKCVRIWEQRWVNGEELTFPTKADPGWYYDILRQYTRLQGIENVGKPFVFYWDGNNMPVFKHPENSLLADQTTFQKMVWKHLFDSALKALTPVLDKAE